MKSYNSFEKFYLNMSSEKKIAFRKEIDKELKSVNEMAYSRVAYIYKVSEHDRKIGEHLVKICCFDNPDDLNGHFRGLNSWIKPKQGYTLKQGKITFDLLYELLWNGWLDSGDKIKEIALELKSKQYKKVKMYDNIDYDILYNEITKVMTKVVNDMLEHKFNDIRDYLNPDEFVKYHD